MAELKPLENNTIYFCMFRKGNEDTPFYPNKVWPFEYNGLKLFVHDNLYALDLTTPQYRASEARTGSYVSEGKTINEAVGKAYDKLSKVPQETLERAVAKMLETHKIPTFKG